ncbi:hypothetical protein F4779DRAFT_642482 [Xylariaceae sp. FL0662B]|nr:hypothetical protein F4779DRAFT_642482 [Xylariaceae sp. FL0662B]
MEGHAGPDAFVTHVPDNPDRPVLNGQGLVSDALQRASYNNNAVPSSIERTTAYPYFSRPLLATQPPKAKMSERPSTSGGPSSKGSLKPNFNFDKRMSRDDSFLNLRAGAGAGFKSYMPARGQLPTPDDSPRMSPAPRTGITPTVRMPTPESLNEVSSIGMALGSPTHQPAGLSSSNQQGSRGRTQTSTPLLVSPGSAISNVGSYDTPLPRKPSGRWKLFSRFTRKPSDPPNVHATDSKPNEPKGKSKAGQSPVTNFQPQSEIRPERSHTVSARRGPKHKPLVARSQTMPYLESTAEEPRLKPNDDKTVHETHERIPIALDTDSSSCGPLLDVQIPTIKMERYSVMFGSVLQSQTSESQPSLLARRQATMKKLKSIDDAIEREQDKKPHEASRRTTSPQSMATPSFALFPPTPANKPGAIPPPKRSPRLRSNTSPALPSPSSAGTFESSVSHRRRPSDISHNRTKSSSAQKGKGKLTIATQAKSGERQSPVRTPQFSPDQSSLILESPAESDFSYSPEIEIVRSVSVRPSQQYTPEPKWQMVTPPPQPPPQPQPQRTPSSAASSATSGQRHRSLSPTSSTNTHITQPPPQDIDDILMETGGNRNPVEISIARQISISRQQRNMLKPLHTNAAAAAATTPKTPRASPAKTSPGPDPSPVRIAATKTATPTFVVPPEPRETIVSPHKLAQHRKSERVVLDRA